MNPLENHRKKRKVETNRTGYSCQPWWLDKFGNANRTIGTLRLHKKVRQELEIPLDLALDGTKACPAESKVENSNKKDKNSSIATLNTKKH